MEPPKGAGQLWRYLILLSDTTCEEKKKPLTNLYPLLCSCLHLLKKHKVEQVAVGSDVYILNYKAEKKQKQQKLSEVFSQYAYLAYI